MRAVLALALASAAAPALAQTADVEALRAELAAARAAIDAQRTQIDAQRAELQRQEARLQALEARLSNGTAIASAAPPPRSPIERVGEAPADFDRPPEVAVLGEQGSVITRAGQFTGEVQLEYVRSDRNRAVFRGVQFPVPILLGVFDINESRQDVLSAAAILRYGVTERFEIGVKLPYVYRNDFSIRVPVAGSTPDDQARSIDESAKGDGIGDIELTARYQLTRARRGSPFLIANLQAVLPTGSDPFAVPRDELGRALKASTGAGFYSIGPSITAILPSDPVVLFGTLGYNFNFGKSVNTVIPPVIIDYVDPGDSIQASGGIGVSFNERATLNLGYAHNWAFGTKTITRLIDPQQGQDPGPRTAISRDLQIGRFLFGVTYRLSDRASVNWSLEVGATDDAADLRSMLRVPIVLGD